MTSKTNFFDDLWSEKVTVPVVLSEGQWTLPDGKPLAIKEGAYAELTLSLSSLVDPDARADLIRKIGCKALEAGQALYVALSDQCNGGARIGPWPAKHPIATPPGTTRWERVVIGTKPAAPPPNALTENLMFAEDADKFGLFLQLKGPYRSELVTKVVQMPEGSKEPTARSLNHAYTMLSEQYEVHRSTHNANIYTKVFYEERTGLWYPLDDLRKPGASAERQPIAHQLWLDVDAELAKPVMPEARLRNKRRR